MRIQFLAGGLANQIRQYVFVRYAERCCPDESWTFDDTYFFRDHILHNGYELEKIFHIKANLLSKQFDADTWQYIMKQRKRGVELPQIFLDAGVGIAMVKTPAYQITFDGVCIESQGYHPEVLSLPYSNVYYFDYRVEDDWFQRYRDENRAELVFPELDDRNNLHYASLLNSHMSVGIHVRRGDFLKLGWEVPEEEYLASCREVLDRYPDVRFFIFSDDLEWCRAHEKELGFNLAAKTIYVEGNINGKNYIDMQLMSMCRGIIRPAQSSFSQVAAWLSKNLEFEIRLGKICC